MYELIEARTRLYPKLARLHGKLSLIASQVRNKVLFKKVMIYMFISSKLIQPYRKKKAIKTRKKGVSRLKYE